MVKNIYEISNDENLSVSDMRTRISESFDHFRELCKLNTGRELPSVESVGGTYECKLMFKGDKISILFDSVDWLGGSINVR